MAGDNINLFPISTFLIGLSGSLFFLLLSKNIRKHERDKSFQRTKKAFTAVKSLQKMFKYFVFIFLIFIIISIIFEYPSYEGPINYILNGSLLAIIGLMSVFISLYYYEIKFEEMLIKKDKNLQ